MERYDLIILGGGPAGYVAAERAGHAGLHVLLAEQRAVGGVCLNEGCIPSKALLYCAKAYHYAKQGKAYGVMADGVSLDHAAVIARKDKVVKMLVRGIEGKMKQNHVEVLKQTAKILGRDEGGFLVQIGEQTCAAKNLLISTGSEPVFPPINGLQQSLSEGLAITSREILSLPVVPEKLVIVGGGVIGLEMAAYYSAAGSHVEVVEMLDHIAGNTDTDISAVLQANLKKEGILFRLGCRVTSICEGRVEYESEQGSGAAEADKVLVCIGRRPHTTGFGLETLSPDMDRAAIKTNSRMCTSVPGLYAAGDVNGRSMLAHTASREAEVAVNQMLGIEDEMCYDYIPEVIYTHPEIASVGLHEVAAKAKGLDISVVKLPMGYSGRYVAEGGNPNGICKTVLDRQTGRILGVSLIAPYASELIFGVGIALERGMTVKELQRVVFPHPTVGEIIRESLFEVEA